MHKCLWICWPSRRDLEEHHAYFQTWVTNHDDDVEGTEGVASVERRGDSEEHSARFLPQEAFVQSPQLAPTLDNVPASNTAVTLLTKQHSVDSSIDLDSEDDSPTLLVQTSDGASQLNDCVQSISNSTDESPVRSPQEPAASGRGGKQRTKAKKFESESRDVLRALPLDSELRFASMVAAAQQAAAAALSQPSPRADVTDCGKTPRNLTTPRSGRTPRSARPGCSSKRDRKVTSSKKKKAQQKADTETQPTIVHI